MKLEGKTLAHKIYAEIKTDLEGLDYQPGLAVILIGEDPASQVYVDKKIKKTKSLGIYSEKHVFALDVEQNHVIEKIQALNDDEKIDAILLQLPLPSHLDEDLLVNLIDPIKDVDAFGQVQTGILVHQQHSIAPCTPSGIMELLRFYDIPIEGQRACVIGRSKIVGMPMFHLLQQAGATLTLCHSKTKDIKEHTQNADIVVVAAGQKEYFDASYFSKESTVIDVGIHRKEDTSLCGDLAPDVYQHVANYSPVPGGVGPLTIASLMRNTLILARERRESYE